MREVERGGSEMRGDKGGYRGKWGGRRRAMRSGGGNEKIGGAKGEKVVFLPF